MAVQVAGSLVCGIGIERICKTRPIANVAESSCRFKVSTKGIVNQRVAPFDNILRHCGLVSDISDVGLRVPELGSTGVSMSIFNIVSKVFNIPLLSVPTLFVVEDITSKENSGNRYVTEKYNGTNHDKAERKLLPSVSTALILAAGIGMLEALAMYFGSGLFLNRCHVCAFQQQSFCQSEQLVLLRLLFLLLSKEYSGGLSTEVNECSAGFGNLAAVFLLPMLIYNFRLGVTVAALESVIRAIDGLHEIVTSLCMVEKTGSLMLACAFRKR
ncbi:hypothetical protein RIF29_37381 [Crotalaria pallida]|uniref:Uncharacterized protein n=1 Tax=Crotalaria pallida TaxID=3830 RepID=A0AAN9HZ42_CROPI